MAREKKQPEAEGVPAWLVTFSDLVTLLLTFFVLILSMSSMDKVMLTEINPFERGFGVINYHGAGRVPQRIKLVVELISDPKSAFEQRDRIKDLLFPEDVLPADIDMSTLDRNLRILQKPEGVAIALTNDLIFAPGSYTLTDSAKVLLSQIQLMLQYTSADSNISGHADNTGRNPAANYPLSGKRAMAVLEFFLKQGLRPDRFSISGYGSDRPLESNATEYGRAMNRRVEILIKTTQRLGRYV
ncbi:MAG: flagellar motor protein MotB [Desulfovibrionales bacterium]|nr:flagellar motor protein MotB [Desulfovibrionales bacterium]